VKDNKPFGILYLQDLNSVLPAITDVKVNEPDSRPLGEFIVNIVNEFITKRKWDKERGIRNFAEVKPDDTLLVARERLYGLNREVNDTRCVVTETTTGEPVAIFSFDSIAAFMKS
jgi:hypothetical protein